MQYNLTDLRLFAAVAELGSLTRAAQRCHLSLPAVSNRIHAIETQARCQLLLREARGVRLTPAGEVFARHARSMLLEADTLQQALREFAGGLQGHVTVLANTTAVTEIMPAVLAGFLCSHPQVSVSLREEANHEIARGVREGRADLGVVAGELDLTGLVSHHFATDRLGLVVAASHPLAAREGVALAEVIEHPMVGLHEHSTLHTFLAQRVQAMGRPLPRPRVQVNGFEALCLMAEAGAGVSIAPESAAQRYGASMRIAWVPLTDAWAVRERYVILREMRHTPGYVQDLVQAICEHAGSRPGMAPASVDPSQALHALPAGGEAAPPRTQDNSRPPEASA